MPITGRDLIALLVSDGWTVVRRANHGLFMVKWDLSINALRTTIVPDYTEDLKPGTLGRILSPAQTGLGSQGLRRLQQNRG